MRVFEKKLRRGKRVEEVSKRAASGAREEEGGRGSGEHKAVMTEGNRYIRS